MSQSNYRDRRRNTMQYDGFTARWPMLCLLAFLASNAALGARSDDATPGAKPAASKIEASKTGAKPPVSVAPNGGCLAGGGGYFRARISGALAVDVQWEDPDFTCSGTVRPQSGGQSRGVRMSFQGPKPSSSSGSQAELVIVLGISQLKEGQSKAHAIPVNVTVIKQGSGEFYGTQGEDKCMLDEIRQAPLASSTSNKHTYRVVARGFCTEPARAIRGPGAILISRFDFAGRIDFASEDTDAQSDSPPSSQPPK